MVKKILSSLTIVSLLSLLFRPFISPDLLAQELTTLRINTGGGNYTDVNGNQWVADTYFNSGDTFSVDSQIENTQDDTIYQSERWDPSTLPELEYKIPVVNGEYEISFHFAEIYSGAFANGARVFDVTIEGVKELDNLDIFSEVGANTAFIKKFTHSVTDSELNILFAHEVENPKISGIEIVPKEQESHLVHADAGDDQVVVDSDGDGVENIILDASFSHTHAFGETIIKWEWSEGAALLASGETVSVNLSLGTHTITLYVEDSAGNSAEDLVVITVIEDTSTPGLAVYYYDFAGSTLNSIPDMNSLKPDWGLIESNLDFESTTGYFSATNFSDHFSAQFIGLIDTPLDGQYTFSLESDDGSKLFIDGVLLIDNDGQHAMQKKSANVNLTSGKHDIKIEFFENEIGAGLKLFWIKPGGVEEVIPSTYLSHQYSKRLPTINSLSQTSGGLAGGEEIILSGFGYVFSPAETVVNWGNVQIVGTSLNIVDDKTIKFVAPAGSLGNIDVSVTTPNANSNTKTYTYSDSAKPAVKFIKKSILSGIDGPTTLAFGPDKKLYVGTQFGEVWVLTLDANYSVTNTFKTDIIQTTESNFRSILGIAFNPLDDPQNPKVYVSHSNLFHGQTQDIYRGKVSTLSGTDLSQKEDLITGLPVSDHDHGVNGMEFGLNGELYLQVGGLTNAGVPGALSSSGTLDEKLFSAATLVAYIDKSNFDGNITYDAQGKQTGGFDIEVFAAGERNSYDLVLHSNAKLYATDNGPNLGYGEKSVNCASQGLDPEEVDELNLLVKGGYYGHANRFRGLNDVRQCIWRSIAEDSDAGYTAPLTTFPPSTNGIAEYWTNNFGGQIKGDLLAARWGGELFKVKLSDGGGSVLENKVFLDQGGLDVAVSWTGAIFITENQKDEIIAYIPDEPEPTSLYIKSLFPNKGPITGGRVVTVNGGGFSQDTQVLIDGKGCNILNFNSKIIECTTPYGNLKGSVDVEVIHPTQSAELQAGYVYIEPEISLGGWTQKKKLPIKLGEVSSVAIGDDLYVLAGHDAAGKSNKKIYKYNSTNDSWLEVAVQNVVPAANHAASLVIDGKIYLFGGILDNNTESFYLAIYNPSTNKWTKGANLTKNGSNFGVGSAAAGVIDGKLYTAGGISKGSTIKNTFVYNPKTNKWGELAAMPQGRNHAAGVGYNGKLYVFGGRCCGGNTTGPGLNDSYVYDPITNSWSEVAQMPTARGGMGSAVELNGELLVIGGEGSETVTGTFATTEAYHPTTNTWRKLTDMPTARHGIYPVSVNAKIHVVSGGTTGGFSVSDIHEVFEPDSSPPPPPPPTKDAIRINSGGGSYTDSSGNTWISDNFFNTGNTFITSSGIAGTEEDAIYQSERWDPSASPELEYAIGVENANYQIVLHFAEIYDGAFFVGGRVFDVTIEGAKVLDNFDIYSQAGPLTALKKSFNVSVSDGTLNILFTHEAENPKISGIEIIPL